MPVIHFPDIPQRWRAYFYRVVAAVLPLIAVLDDGFDVKDPADLAAALGCLAAVLATANTSTSPTSTLTANSEDFDNTSIHSTSTNQP